MITGSSLTVGDLVAFLYYLNQFYRRCSRLSAMLFNGSYCRGHFRDRYSARECRGHRKPLIPSEIDGAIEFRDVHFPI